MENMARYNGQNRYYLNVQGCDVLLDVEHFTGREAISDTYHYQITLPSGEIIKGISDSEGKTTRINSNAINDILIKLLPYGENE